jgi:tryptophanyl-tRNA synthetase
MGWGTFKPLLAEAMVEALRPIQERHACLSADPAELDRVLQQGRERANAVADATLERTREALGFLAKTQGSASA